MAEIEASSAGAAKQTPVLRMAFIDYLTERLSLIGALAEGIEAIGAPSPIGTFAAEIDNQAQALRETIMEEWKAKGAEPEAGQ